MTLTAKQEWAANWQLPLLAMLGIAGAATFGYSSGVFMEADDARIRLEPRAILRCLHRADGAGPGCHAVSWAFG